jgi:hypothetical protein
VHAAAFLYAPSQLWQQAASIGQAEAAVTCVLQCTYVAAHKVSLFALHALLVSLMRLQADVSHHAGRSYHASVIIFKGMSSICVQYVCMVALRALLQDMGSRYPDGLPLLDPVEDMGITGEHSNNSTISWKCSTVKACCVCGYPSLPCCTHWRIWASQVTV